MPLSPSVFILGAGNVGLGLALALQRRGTAVALWNRGAERARRAREQLGQPVDCGSLPPPQLAHARHIIIAVRDDAISTVAAQLPSLPADALVAHTSGCLSAAALGPLRAHRGSMHPLLACPTPEHARDGLASALFVLEGDADALPRLHALVSCLGARSCIVTAAAKPRYHAAAVLASNLLVALLDLAIGAADEAGIPAAADAFTRFAGDALANARSLGPLAALTGPALRGDTATLAAHVAALDGAALAAYRVLSRQALTMAARRGLPAADVARALTELAERAG